MASQEQTEWNSKGINTDKSMWLVIDEGALGPMEEWKYLQGRDTCMEMGKLDWNKEFLSQTQEAPFCKA